MLYKKKSKKKKTKWYKPGDFKIITGHGISAKNEGKVPIKNILKSKAKMQGKNIKAYLASQN